MKTIETVLYKFEELSEEAKETAIEEYRGHGVDTSHYWQEAHESVKGFHDVFGTKEGTRSWLDINTGHIEDEILQLSGNRLRTYLINNFEEAFYERKYRNSHHIEERPKTLHRMRSVRTWMDGGYWVTLRSNFLTESCCPFTGVCYDESLLNPMKKFIESPDGRTFEDLLNESMETLRTDLENEDEYRDSDEAIEEEIKANGYEFTEDGNRY